MSCLCVEPVHWWTSVNTAPTLQYRLRLLSFRKKKCHFLPGLLIRQWAFSLCKALSSRQEEWNNGLWRLFVVFCRVQLVKSGWAFSSESRRSKWSGSRLSNGCTPRLHSLTGSQRGKVLNVGHKVVCYVDKVSLKGLLYVYCNLLLIISSCEYLFVPEICVVGNRRHFKVISAELERWQTFQKLIF